jgi:hypothetical protein
MSRLAEDRQEIASGYAARHDSFAPQTARRVPAAQSPLAAFPNPMRPAEDL